jgi:zinc transporter 1
LNVLIGFIVALAAVQLLMTLNVQVTERKTSPEELSFGWAPAQLLGAFFNSLFLLARGLSITMQSVKRFIKIQEVEL